MAPYSGEDSLGPECADDAGATHVFTEDDTHNYFINTGSVPTADITRSAAVTALTEATANIDWRRTTCDPLVYGAWGNSNSRLVTYYAGQTTLFADINLNGCAQRDDVNVLSFGARPAGVLATSCTWHYPLIGDLVEADVEFDATHTSWTTTPKALSCLGAYDLEAGATHERGHSFGLEHVEELTHKRSTMSTDIDGPCQAQERSLGYGDVLALRGKY